MQPHLAKVSWLRRRPAPAFLLLSGVVTLLLYWRSFSSPFVYDDLDQIVNNPNFASWSAFVQRFVLHPVFLTGSFLGYAGSTYRPLFWLSLFIDKAIWGLNAGGFHATNVAVHLANGNLGFALLRRLGVRMIEAASVCLVWLALPINTEVVAWISGRSYALCSLFVLICLLSALHAVGRGGFAWLGMCFAGAACAVLSNELGIVILPLLLLLVFLKGQQRSRSSLLPLGTVCLAAFGIEVLRVSVGVRSFSGFASARWVSLALWKYLALTIFPLHMSVERSTTISLSQRHPWLPAAIAFVAVLFGFAVLRRRKNPALLSGLLWFAICVAPFVVLLNYQGLAERYAYLASFGIATAVISLCFVSDRLWVRKLLMVAVSAWAIWSACRTVVRVADWSDPVRLYRSSLRATPQSPAIWYNLGYSLRTRGDLPGALEGYKRALQLDGRYPHGLASLGDVYLQSGAFASAQAAYQEALAQTPDDVAVLLNSGAAYQSAGFRREAENTYLRILNVDPASSAAHVNLGVLYVDQKRLNEAAHQFAMAIDLKTKDPTPYYDLGVLFEQAGRPDLAVVLYKKVLELKPGDRDAMASLRRIGDAR